MQVIAAMKTAKLVSASNPPMVPVAVMELLASIGANTQPNHFAVESAFPGQCMPLVAEPL